MRRREFMALMGASVTWPFAALAQEPGRTYRLGILFAGMTQELWNAILARGGTALLRGET